MLEYLDIHAHVNFPQFEPDREEVINRTQAARTGWIEVGTDKTTSEAAVKLATEYPQQVWASVGLHPTDWAELDQPGATFELYESLAQNKPVVAIGECGLDYARLEGDIEGIKIKQQDIFRQHVDLALKLGKPLMIHCRDAYSDLYTLLTTDYQSQLNELRANLHCYVGDLLMAKKFLELGFSLSFTGIITFARDYDEVVQYVPLGQLMVETDCPFLTPIPNRGKRNEPALVARVAEKVAEIKRLHVEEVKLAVLQNANRIFKLGIF